MQWTQVTDMAILVNRSFRMFALANHTRVSCRIEFYKAVNCKCSAALNGRRDAPRFNHGFHINGADNCSSLACMECQRTTASRTYSRHSIWPDTGQQKILRRYD